MNSVKSADRVLDLIEAFGEARRPLSLSELAERIGAPASSCHGLVHTLQRRGYLYPVAHRRLVYPTRRLHDLGATLLAHDPVLERIAPLLASLRDATGETIIAGKRDGDAVVYLDVVESTQTVRYTARPGEHKPLHSSAIGKALLGPLPAAERATLLCRLDLHRVTAETLTSTAALEADLEAGRGRGWFVTRGENVADVTAVAVPVTAGPEPLGVAVAGPSHRMADAVEVHARRLLDARARLGAQAAA